MKRNSSNRAPPAPRQNPQRVQCQKCNWYHNKAEKCVNTRCPLNKPHEGRSGSQNRSAGRGFKAQETRVEQGDMEYSHGEESGYESERSWANAQERDF